MMHTVKAPRIVRTFLLFNKTYMQSSSLQFIEVILPSLYVVEEAHNLGAIGTH